MDPEESFNLIKEAWKDDSPSGIIYRQKRVYFPYIEEEDGEVYTYHKTEELESSDNDPADVLRTTIDKYDSNGNLIQTQIQGPDNYYLTTGYKYNEHDDITWVRTRKSSTVDWNGTPDVTYCYTYDQTTGRKEKEAMIDGYGVWHVTEYVDDNEFPQDRISTTYVEYGGTKAQETIYTYYGSGDSTRKFLLQKITDPKGNETVYDYNSDHTIKTITDPKGRVTEYVYDESESNSYSQPWKLKRPGPNGELVTEYEYNDLGRVTKVTNPPAESGGTSFITEFTYDKKGRQLTRTEKYGTTTLSTTTNVYDDDSGFVKEVRRDPGDVGGTVYVLAKYEYDYSGAVTKVHNAGGGGITGGDSEVIYEYDDLGQKIKDKYKIGTDSYIEMAYQYWPDGSLKQITDERDVDIQYTYDSRNLLDTIDYENDANVTFTYNSKGSVSTVSRDGRTVTYTYDECGRLTDINGPWGKNITFDDFGSDTWVPKKLGYPGHAGSKIEYTYNDYGLLTKIKDVYNGGRETEYHYDHWTDEIERVDLPNGSHARYWYDDIGRLTRLRNYKSNNVTINQFDYSYKNNCACTSGAIDKITFEDGRYVEYDYDDMEWLSKEDYKDAEGTSYMRHDFTYDDCDGNRLTMKFDDDSSELIYWADDRSASETTVPTNFDASNQLEKVWTDTTNSKTAGDNISVGGRYTEEEPDKIEVTPGNDDPAWGTTVEAQTVRDGLFIARGVVPYDRNDNKFKAVVTDMVGNTSDATTVTGVDFDDEVDEELWYDVMGNIEKRVKTYTYQQGVDDIVETTRYFYDDANRLEYVDLQGDDVDHMYIYGPLGNRIAILIGTVSVDGNGDWSGWEENDPSEARKFVYLDGSVIQEYDNSLSLKYEYIRGLGLGGGIGSILYQREDASPDKFYYYHYNHKGDVYALTDHPADTNDVEELMALYEYDAWGRTTVQALKDGVTNEFRFSTKQHDPDTGLIYFGARYYDPTLSRWTQMDPVVADLNLYLYVGNAVTQMIDPSGAMPEWVRRICPGNAPITPSDRPDISGACNLVDCLKKVNKWVSKYERICQRRFRGLPIGGYKGKILHGKCAQQCMGYDDMKSRSGDTKWWGIRDSAGNWVWIYSGGVTEIERQYNHKCKTKFP